MKKIYLSLFSALVAAGSFAQAPVQLGGQHKDLPARLQNKVVTPMNIQRSASRATSITSEPVNAIDAVTTAYGYSSPYVGAVNPIWPDSNMLIGFSSGPSGAWLHGVAQVFDFDGFSLKNSTFNPGILPFDPAASMTIDSVEFQAFYLRDNPTTTVVDTAVIQIVDASANFTRALFASNPDSAKVVIDITSQANNTYAGVLGTYKIALDSVTAYDTTASGTLILKAITNLTLPSHDGLVGVIVDFIPGTTYGATDTIFSNVNALLPIYCTPAGQGLTYPNGIAPDNTGGVFHDDNSKYTPGLNYMLPAVGFVGDHPYQLYDITTYVTQSNSLNASIDELENGAKLYQNFPNPTADFTTVKYSLEEAANVTFEMIDITGKTVLASVEGNKSNGVHTITVDTKDLNAGVYFYSVIVNGSKLTKKMTVSK